MTSWTGYFNSSGSPSLKITIRGVIQAQQEFEAIIDTGFSGFVAMPLLRAFPLGLILSGTTNVVLADASTAVKLMAWGMTVVHGEEESGMIILEPNSDEVLVGMAFLNRYGRILKIDPASQVLTLDPPLPSSSPKPQS